MGLPGRSLSCKAAQVQFVHGCKTLRLQSCCLGFKAAWSQAYTAARPLVEAVRLLIQATSLSGMGCKAAWPQGCMATWLRGCKSARLHGCMAARLHGCMAARLHGCKAAWLQGCMAAWLQGCMAARLHGCKAAWLHGCKAAWLSELHGCLSWNGCNLLRCWCS